MYKLDMIQQGFMGPIPFLIFVPSPWTFAVIHMG